MRRLTGLSRQIVLSMMAVVFGAVVLVILGSYGLYFAMLVFWPERFPVVDDWMPSGLEWAWMLLTTLSALALAMTVATKLARRILVPLNSVALSLRRVAGGDLTARALSEDRSLGEAALLVDDFNSLAERLQRMAHEQKFWNAAIAHELRTPVTILRGRLQGLAEGVFAPDEKQFRSLLVQVEGLAHLIEDLRVVGLSDSGHLALELREADLLVEIETIVRLFEPGLRSAGLVPILDLEPRPVRCDPARIRQALLALLENSRRHAVPGELRIQTSIQDGWYYLQVEDSGPGIPEEIVGRIFDAFQRGDQSRSRGAAGSGLGLAVVRAIAQAHSGQAVCRPSFRGGTIFELGWPVVDLL